jgi:drug/metabolite transporter (DMT)-like permease
MWNGILCGLLAGALWGLVFIVPEVLSAFSPLEMAVGRYVAYGLIASSLMALRLPALLRRLEPGDYTALLRHAMTGNILYYMLLVLGVKLAGVAPTSLIIGLLPISVTMFGHKDHGAVPLRRLVLPLLIVGAGIACINIDLFSRSSMAGVQLTHTMFGVLSAAGALLCWTWYAIDNARYLKRNPHFSSAEWSALYGISSGLIALFIGVLAWGIGHGGIADSPAFAAGRDWSTFWIANSLLALGASVIGNRLWNFASRSLPVTLSGQLILFETLFALLYAFMYQQRPPRMLEIAAIVLLIVGVIWSVRVHAEPIPA